MIWSLTSGATVFAITDGVGRLYQSLERLEAGMRQTTQVATPSRAAWPVAFPDRASRSLSFDLPVMFPPCASLELAFAQSLDVPLQCPRGGVLTGLLGDTLRTYSQAWVDEIITSTMGVTNHFTFKFSAVNPTVSTPSLIALMDARYPNILTLTGLTGGGASNLDGQVTTDVAAGRMVDFYLAPGGVLQPHRWVLTAWTDETEDAEDGRVLPDDFDETTNAKIWQRLI